MEETKKRRNAFAVVASRINNTKQPTADHKFGDSKRTSVGQEPPMEQKLHLLTKKVGEKLYENRYCNELTQEI